MFVNGQTLDEDNQFLHHVEYHVPVQVYFGREHNDIGYIHAFTPHYVQLNNTIYSRQAYTFVSRPGY